MSGGPVGGAPCPQRPTLGAEKRVGWVHSFIPKSGRKGHLSQVTVCSPCWEPGPQCDEDWMGEGVLLGTTATHILGFVFFFHVRHTGAPQWR